MTDQQQNMPGADDLVFGGGSPSAQLKDIGQSIEGFITAKRTRQARNYHRTDASKRTPKTYDDGSPVMELVLDLKTNLRDPEVQGDDGTRTVYFKAAWKKELGNVLRAAGEKTIPLGGWLRITRTHDEPGEGAEPKKMVRIEFRSAADMSTVQDSTPAPTQYQTPAPGPAAAAPAVNPELAAALAALDPATLAAIQAQAKQ